VQETKNVSLGLDGAIARLTFERPGQLNALSPALISEALQATRQVAESDARVLIVTGAGKSFSAGVDLKAVSTPDYTREVARRFSEEARELATLFETMRQPTIAMVRGHCFTGGLELAIGCDFIVAADDAQFCDTHGKLGLRPGWGLSQRLPKRIGVMRAKEMSYTGRRLDAATAQAYGLILEHVPGEALEARVTELAEQMAGMQGDALFAYKELYRASENMGLDEGLAFETGFRRPKIEKPLTSHLKS
jgi:enoyl-CoA hydratase/carnithine racemase